MISTKNQCIMCKHYGWVKTAEGDNACEAFPDGIPPEVKSARVDHRRSLPGDSGVVFEPIPTASAKHLAHLFEEFDR